MLYAKKDNPDLATANYNLGRCLQQLDNPQAAEFFLQQALVLRKEHSQSSAEISKTEAAIEECLAQLGSMDVTTHKLPGLSDTELGIAGLITSAESGSTASASAPGLG